MRRIRKMESKERRRKTVDTRHEFQRQLGIAIGKSLFVIGLVLLIPTIVFPVFFPFAVFLLCLGVTCYIMSKYEEWFYPKRTAKSSTAQK
jgi:uncharacterized membrane-anchored protein YitT (DUF2179 family)